MLSACANISLSDLENSGADDYIRMHEDSFDAPLITSTPLRTVQSLSPPAFSPLRGTLTTSTSSQLSEGDEQTDQSNSQSQDQLNPQLLNPDLQVTQRQPEKDANPDSNAQAWRGFKIVGDNIDKTIRPRRQRYDQQTKSLHYFNIMAVQDRIDLSKFSDEKSSLHLSIYFRCCITTSC